MRAKSILFALMACVLVTTVYLPAGRKPPPAVVPYKPAMTWGERRPKEKRWNEPYLEIGTSFDLRTGADKVYGCCTTFEGFKIKELRVGLIVFKGDQETVIEERLFTWNQREWSMFDKVLQPSRGVLQLHWIPRRSGVEKSYELAFGAGNDLFFRKSAQIHEPLIYTVERMPSSGWYKQGFKTAGTQHVARVDAISGRIDDQGTLIFEGPSSFNESQEEWARTIWGLRVLAKKYPHETYMATTLQWLPWEEDGLEKSR
jgi:hypothetical protein